VSAHGRTAATLCQYFTPNKLLQIDTLKVLNSVSG